MVDQEIEDYMGFSIRIRRSDGYLNASDMCKVTGTEYNKYSRLEGSKKYFNALSKKLNISADKLSNSIINGPFAERGTWIHPRVAIHIGIWLSEDFAVQVTDWVIRIMNGDLSLAQEIVDVHNERSGDQVVLLQQENKLLKSSLEEAKLAIHDRELAHEKVIARIETTYEKTVAERDHQLKEVKDTLNQQLEEIRNNDRALTCKYCSKKYSSTAGVTRHVNNHCDEKCMHDFVSVVDFDKFKAYINVIVDNGTEFESFKMETDSWDSDNPILAIVFNGSPKKYRYHAKKNSSRRKVLAYINKEYSIPVDLLIDASTLNLFQENQDIAIMFSDMAIGEQLYRDELIDALTDAA